MGFSHRKFWKVGVAGKCFQGTKFLFYIKDFFFFNQIHILRKADSAAVGGSPQIAARGMTWL